MSPWPWRRRSGYRTFRPSLASAPSARGLRLSRRWCRATRGDQSRPRPRADRGTGCSRPPDRRHSAGHGRLAPRRSPTAGDGKVPVIGTGGPLEEASGMMVFMEAARLVDRRGPRCRVCDRQPGKPTGRAPPPNPASADRRPGHGGRLSQPERGFLERSRYLLSARRRRQCAAGP